MLYITFSQSVSLASLWFKHIKRAFQFSPAFYQLANIKLCISKVLTLTRNKKVSNMIDLFKKNFMEINGNGFKDSCYKRMTR